MLAERHADPMGTALDQVQLASRVTPELLCTVIDETRVDPPILPKPGTDDVARIGRLIELGAWTDAGLALIELELPKWKLRCLDFADGSWCCTLTKGSHPPVLLREIAEGRHQVLPLAILSAILKARQREN